MLFNAPTSASPRTTRAAAVFRFDPERGELQRVVRDVAGPNGLAFSPAERRLYLVEPCTAPAVYALYVNTRGAQGP